MINLPRLRNSVHLRVMLVVSVVVRLCFWLGYSYSHPSAPTSEYDIISSYMVDGKGYSCISQTQSGDDFTFTYLTNASPQPSAFMMPGYTMFLYLIKSSLPAWSQWFVIALLQSFAASLVCFLVVRLVTRIVSPSAALAAGWLYALMPEFIIAAVVPASVVFTHAGVCAIVLLCMRQDMRLHQQLWLLIAVVLLVSIRAESLLFLAFVALIAVYKKNVRGFVAIALGVALVLVPWTLRNAEAMGRFVPLTTSGGVNLYRGHNEHGIGTWSDDALRSELRSLPFTNSIEYSIDSVHRSAALQSIANDPVRAFTRGIDKSLSLLLLDRRDERSFHPVYLLQTLVFLVLCAWGFIAFHRKKYSIPSELRAYIIASLLTAAVFFCLPRYQTMFRIALLPYAGYAASVLVRRPPATRIAGDTTRT